MESARYNIFTKKKKTPKVVALELFYHIIWPYVSAVHLNLLHHEEHLSYYPEPTKKIVAFDNYQEISAKDHKRIRQASGVVLDYDLYIARYLLP